MNCATFCSNKTYLNDTEFKKRKRLNKIQTPKSLVLNLNFRVTSSIVDVTSGNDIKKRTRRKQKEQREGGHKLMWSLGCRELP